MSEAVNTQVLHIMQEVLGAGIGSDTRRSEWSGWDSLKHIELILRLEETLQIRFSVRDVAAIQCLEDIVRIVEVKR